MRYLSFRSKTYTDMWRYLIFFVLSIHGLIHLIGYSRSRSQLSGGAKFSISKPAGIFWFIAAVLFLCSAGLLLARFKLWWVVALPGIVISQSLIIKIWKEARFGTTANVMILLAIIVGLLATIQESRFLNDAGDLRSVNGFDDGLLSESDIAHLPSPVQKYIRYTGALGKPKVNSFHAVFDGELRERDKKWFGFHSEQFNRIDDPARLFFLTAQVNGLPTSGYHKFLGLHASMRINVLSMLPVVSVKGPELDTAETVTWFNDLCILAPAALIDRRIQWKEIDSLNCEALFEYKGIRISAQLLFDTDGKLVNFISNDRYALNGKTLTKFRFSTPISEYRDFNGMRLASKGDAIWDYPEGPFTYGKFLLRAVSYNNQ